MEFAGVAQTGRASAFQAEGRGFESRRPLVVARVAQLVERFLGKDEVTGSIPVASLECRLAKTCRLVEPTALNNTREPYHG